MLERIIFFLIVLFAADTKPNLFLGAGGFGYGCGSNSPYAQRPFSYVRLGPDTTPNIKKIDFSFQHYGGYSTADQFLRAFSHMHLVGAGVIDLGVLGILPIQKQKVQIPNDQKVSFFKTTQQAVPGYYKAVIQNDIKVQLTSTQRVGVHKYTFPNSKKTNQILIMSSYLLQKKATRSSTTISCGKNCINGDININSGFGGRFGGYHIYYHLEWKSDQNNQKIHFFNDTKIQQNQTQMTGNFTGAVITTNSENVQLYVGISYVSIKNAQQNMRKQTLKRNFDQIKQESLKIWEQELNRFQITAISQDFQTKIDTAIYRTFQSPTLFNDLNGQYPSFKKDGSISIKPIDMSGVYTDMSLWDVHRSQMPWLLFHDAKRFNDIAKSLILFNRQGGYMPKWPFANGYTGCMIGAHGNTVLADWIIKQGKKDPNVNISQILSYMIRNANTNTVHDSRYNPTKYLQKGYIPADNDGRSACSQTLQYSYNDFGISRVASLINDSQTQKDFLNRSTFYKNVFNNKTKFFQPKFQNQSFVGISVQERTNIFSNHYVEGDAWHYRFYAPHDASGLVQLFGGKDIFTRQLQIFFKRSVYWPTLWLPNPYYWAGNQHDLFSVWLFNFVDRHDLTSKYSRKILQTQYGLEGNGLPGNDDYGTMSAWLIFASLGFYPLPSTQTYVLGSPTIHSATILRRTIDGKMLAFNIGVKNNSVKRFKVSQVLINGRQIKNFVSHSQLNEQNSVLSFLME